MSSWRCRSFNVASATAAPSAVGNFQTVMVAIYISPGGCRPGRSVRGSGIEDLALLELELGVVEDAGVVQLPELAQLGELGVGVGPRRRGRGRGRLGVLLLRFALGLLVGPPVALPSRDAVGHGGRRAGDDGGAGNPAEQSHVDSFGRCVEGGQPECAPVRAPGRRKAAHRSSSPKTAIWRPRT